MYLYIYFFKREVETFTSCSKRNFVQNLYMVLQVLGGIQGRKIVHKRLGFHCLIPISKISFIDGK